MKTNRLFILTALITMLTANVGLADDQESYSASFAFKPKSQKNNISFEAEFSQKYSDAKEISEKGEIETAGLMANTIYKPVSKKLLKPYIGMGAGVAHLSLDGVNFDSGKTSQVIPAYQLITGFTYESGRKSATSIKFGYKYIDSLDGSSNIAINNGVASSKFDVAEHKLEANLSLKF
jgi:hypothetical protein